MRRFIKYLLSYIEILTHYIGGIQFQQKSFIYWCQFFPDDIRPRKKKETKKTDKLKKEKSKSGRKKTKKKKKEKKVEL